MIGIVFVISSVFMLCSCAQVDDRHSPTPNAAPIQSATSQQTAPAPEPPEKLADNIAIEGTRLQAVNNVLTSFKADSDIPEDKKDLSKYRLELESKNQEYLISLIVRRNPNKIYIGGETDEGKDIVYRMDGNGKIIERAFPK